MRTRKLQAKKSLIVPRRSKLDRPTWLWRWHHLLSAFVVFFGIGMVIASLQYNTFKQNQAHASTAQNLMGWIWADPIGWISVNSANANACASGTCGTYGLKVDANSQISGFAWNDDAGWICFGSSCSAYPGACGSVPPPSSASLQTTCHSTGSMIACLDPVAPAPNTPFSVEVHGWADVCNLGDQGWISLDNVDVNFGATAPAYKYVVKFIPASGKFGFPVPPAVPSNDESYAWGGNSDGTGYGYLDFSNVNISPEVGSCTDAVDNDFNGLIDCKDGACGSDSACKLTCVKADGTPNCIACPAQPACLPPTPPDEASCGAANGSHPGWNAAQCCSDSVDNDGNTLTDCADATCHSSSVCQEIPTNVNVGKNVCADKIDDDGNGAIDCADLGCKTYAACVGTSCLKPDGVTKDCSVAGCCAPPDEAHCSLDGVAADATKNADACCSDGSDNNADGQQDCADLSCKSAGKCAENGTNTNFNGTVNLCADMIDDNGNGKIDCADPGCATYATCKGVPPNEAQCGGSVLDKMGRPATPTNCCSDNFDNDVPTNGAKDCADLACKSSPACDEKQTNVNLPGSTLCTDGIDDNGNGAVDCQELTCSTNPTCATCPLNAQGKPIDCLNPKCTSLPACTACKTNGVLDCTIPGCCVPPPTPDEASCGGPTGKIADLGKTANQCCADGLDNDANGFGDCSDYSCQTGASACAENSINVNSAGLNLCKDGIDDDGNGKIDCGDLGCTTFPGCILTGEPACGKGAEQCCSDGVDNDSNGSSDCTDTACLNSANVCLPAWFQAKYGNVYAQNGIQSSGVNSRGSYCLTSNGRITGVSSGSSCTEEQAGSISVPNSSSGYKNTLGGLDLPGIRTGRYGKVITVAGPTWVTPATNVLSGNVYRITGNVTMSATTFQNGSGTTKGNGLLFVDGGNLTITGDVKYRPNEALPTSLRSLASFGVIVSKDPVTHLGGDLTILPSVAQVSGAYFVEGTVHTGTTGSNDTTRLEVFGLMVAHQFDLQRQYHDQNLAAETFTFDGRAIANPPPGMAEIGKSLPTTQDASFAPSASQKSP